MNAIESWFAAKGWRPFEYQRRTWDAYLQGRSGLVHAPTGMGKSYSVWLALLLEWINEHPDRSTWASMAAPPISVLWITPMRALANDILVSLETPLRALGVPWTVEMRTGDTTEAVRRRQRERLPTALVTTPESLSLMLSYPDAETRLNNLRCVVVDEWHELLGSKRGVQTELALARLRRWNGKTRTWGLSATLGNLDEALEVLLGSGGERPPAELISGETPKEVTIETILPDDVEKFPWSGHLGLKLLDAVIGTIERGRTSLVFTNTRSQTEIWFRALLAARPDWAADLALHHGSLDRDLRAYVEGRLRAGDIRAVVCTSSLDLGVDFSPVDQVIQIGSPKGVARLLQRAGRSGHQPGAISRVVCVPTHAFELVEYAAARQAAVERQIEGREPLDRPLDVLVQHLVTMALAGGFEEKALFDEVRTAYAYRNLTPFEWQWALDFVTRGGYALRAYSQYSKIAPAADGRYYPATPQVARWHRMAIGTITSESSMLVKYLGGSSLGTIEESFIARLRPGDRFVFAGQTLELVRVKEMTAYVRKSKQTSGVVPRWDGGRFPLSSQLAAAVRRKFAEARCEIYEDPEMQWVRPILELQDAWSYVPGPGELLIEMSKVREGHQMFMYPFEGRSVNEGLASLLAFRIARDQPRSITVTPNDYGFELLSSESFEFDEPQWRRLLSRENLLEDLLACLNAAELARRQFRDIARVAGLVFRGYPGTPKTNRQLQASTSLLYDVFVQYDPDNLLVDQARREVLDRQLEASRLGRALARIEQMDLVLKRTPRLTPLAFPLWAARIQTSYLSTEKWTTRVQRMVLQLEKAAGPAQVTG